MCVIVRQRNSRRRYLPVRFPLTDSRGELVATERRRLQDRRKVEHDIQDLKVILSKIYSN